MCQYRMYNAFLVPSEYVAVRTCIDLFPSVALGLWYSGTKAGFETQICLFGRPVSRNGFIGEAEAREEKMAPPGFWFRSRLA